MNIERLNYAIEIMRQAKNLDMTRWQSGERVNSIEELHTCGNTACFAGYLAISPEWDGEVSPSGQPYYPPRGERLFELYGSRAIQEFLGIETETHKEVIRTVVNGVTEDYGYNPSSENDLWDLTERSQNEFEIASRVGVLVEDRPWSEWRPEEVIKILEALRDGHFDDIELAHE